MEVSSAWLVYDILVVAIVAYFSFTNARKGFGLIVISAIGYILSCVICSVASNLFAPVLYESTLKPDILDKTHSIVAKYDAGEEMKKCIADITYNLDVKSDDALKTINKSNPETLDSSIYKFIRTKSPSSVSSVDEVTDGIVEGLNDSMYDAFHGNLPDLMTKHIRSFTVENKEEAFELWKTFAEDKSAEEKAAVIEEKYIRENAVQFVKLFMFIVLFFILMAVFKLIEAKAVSRDKVFTLSKYDNAAGCAVGLIESAAMVFILCIFVKFALLLSDGTAELFNEDVINQSKIFSWFYNFNFMR